MHTKMSHMQRRTVCEGEGEGSAQKPHKDAKCVSGYVCVCKVLLALQANHSARRV